MKLVDMKDLKSFGPNGPCGFESRSGYHIGKYLLKLIPCRKSNWLHMGSSPILPTQTFLKKSFKKICLYEIFYLFLYYKIKRYESNPEGQIKKKLQKSLKKICLIEIYSLSLSIRNKK